MISTIVITAERNRSLAEARLSARKSLSISAPMPLGYAQSGGCSERKKDPTHNKVIGNQGDTTAEERQTAEQSKVARLGVHSRSRLGRGSDQAAP